MYDADRVVDGLTDVIHLKSNVLRLLFWWFFVYL